MKDKKLPKNWIFCTLGDVIYLKHGYAFKSSDFLNQGLPVIRISDIDGASVNTNNTVKVKENIKYDAFKIAFGDLLIAMSGATTGKLGVYLNYETSLQNQRVGNIKIKNENLLCDKYRNYFFYSLTETILKLAYGGAQPNISSNAIERIPFALPPLKEQQRIVAKIEGVFKEIDASIAQLTATQTQINTLKQSILLGAFNFDASKCVLSEVTTKINDGTHFTPTYLPEGISFISVKDIRNKQISFTNCKYISPEEHAALFKRCNPEYGDVLITKSGTIGRTAIVDTKIPFSLFVSVALLKPLKEKITSKYLMYALDKYISCIDIAQDVKGGVVKNLHVEDIRKIEIPLPSIPEQRTIVAEIEKHFAVADEMQRAVDAALEQAKQLKQSILKKAFAGELVPQDPNDEPASVLLERIKAERAEGAQHSAKPASNLKPSKRKTK